MFPFKKSRHYNDNGICHFCFLAPHNNFSARLSFTAFSLSNSVEQKNAQFVADWQKHTFFFLFQLEQLIKKLVAKFLSVVQIGS